MKLYLLLSSFLFSLYTYGQKDDKLLQLLKQELQYNMKELQKQELPPYFMSYRVIERKTHDLSASFGVLLSNRKYHERSMIPQIRIGDVTLDNFRNYFNGNNANSIAELPYIGVIDDAVRQAIWNETNKRYRFAVQIYKDSKAKQSIHVEAEDKAPSFSEATVETYYEAPTSDESFNSQEWSTWLCQLSNLFNGYENMLIGSATLFHLEERRYFVDTEGREIVQNLPYVRLIISGMIKADDGMELPLNLSYFAYSAGELPAQDIIISDTKQLITKLLELRKAPIVGPYTGPAILSGTAAGVFFHEIFGHRIEGQRMKGNEDGQTFKKLIGQRVLPEVLSVCDDPTRKEYNGEALNGYYLFDDQGVRAELVSAVENGVLKEFLMTRTPIDGHPRSNGHARGEQGFDAVSRQSNLIIETNDWKSDEELKGLLIKEAKQQGVEYGYFFKEVTGGLTYTGIQSINSFNVTPLEVYRIYTDGRPDELVRGVDLIGTPLSMFSNIQYAGGKSEVFTGMCVAESGAIPVTAISPYILVNKIEIQRKAKSNNIPPVLPIPTVQ